jgi:hypothetical protein
MPVLLTDWDVRFAKDFFASPENHEIFVTGKCFGHPKYKDGTKIKVSKIVSFEDGVFRTFTGREYRFGDVSKEYSELFPNAFARLVFTIEKHGTKEL